MQTRAAESIIELYRLLVGNTGEPKPLIFHSAYMRRVPGMTSLDNAIMEYFESMGRHEGEFITEKPGDVWHNLHNVIGVTTKSRTTVNRRMQQLVDAGLLAQDETDRYHLTDFGWRYIQGDLDEDERADLKDELLS